MIIQCPHCGKSVVANGLGRKPLNLPVKIVYDTLRQYSSVTRAAEKLGCSRAFIYQELKKQGLTARDVIRGQRVMGG